MTTAASQLRSPAKVVFEYHDRSKHHLSKYAAGPETLDWTMPPDPFREFAGSPRVLLPLNASSVATRFSQIYQPGDAKPVPLSIESVGTLLQLSMGLTAWKEYGPDRWALRSNPSSGNLHPTEAYIVCQQVAGLENGLYHYVSRDHALEQRCRLTWDDGPETTGRLWIGLSSVHWREAWKYGERAFRYCQLDVGHAIGALRYAAGALGWTLRCVHPHAHSGLARLLGLDRAEDFPGAENEDADLLLEVIPDPRERRPPDPLAPGQRTWAGRANVLDPHPMYRWPVIDQIAAATQQEAVTSKAVTPETDEHTQHPPLAESSPERAVDVIFKRRSAQQFDRTFQMSARVFHHLLDCLLVRPAAPWDVWSYAPRIHPFLFVHGVEGVAPGLYALLRRPAAEERLRRALKSEFLWQRPEGTPEHLPFFLLQKADCRQMAKTLSCHQAIAAHGCFSLAMVSEFEEIVNSDPWRYRQLHWEAGLLGHVLYLETEAAGLRGTGIGCYFDDAVHEILGLRDAAFAALYHFTVGRPLTDDRMTTLAPYLERHL